MVALGTILLVLAAIFLTVWFYRAFMEYKNMSYDYLYRLKEFTRVSHLNDLIKDLKLTPDQIAIADAAIKKDGYFLLKNLNLDSNQLEVVKNSVGELEDAYKFLSIVLGIAALVVVAALTIGIISKCCCNSNKSMGYNNSKIEFDNSKLFQSANNLATVNP